MRHFLRAIVVAVACGAGVVAFVPGAGAAGGGASPVLDLQGAWRQGRSKELLALLDEHVEWSLKANPVDASQRGDDRYATLLPDVSPGAVARRVAEVRDRLTRLRAIDAGKLGDMDRLDYDLLEYELADTLAAADLHGEQVSVDAKSGPQVSLPQMCESLPLSTETQRANYAARLERIPVLIDQTMEEMRLGMRAGRVQPRVVMAGTAEQCFVIASPDVKETPALSAFYKPFRGLPVSDPSAARARRAIVEQVLPAFERFGAFLRDEYIPACRETIGYSEGVDGPRAYELALRRHTTTSRTADEIHRVGLDEVARIRAEMMGVISRTDYSRKGELEGNALFKAFTEYLRTDKRFYYDDPDRLLDGYRAICKRMDAELPRLFGKLPRMSYGVRALPMLVAPTAPTAYYYQGSARSGVSAWFMANTYRLDQRPKYEMTALALHESVPGHHLQIAISQELEGMHPFRTFTNYTAFVEGWGLYSERLGLEVGGVDGEAGPGPSGRGLYADPYDDFGRLSYEMWRACRLVVDTGMHAKGWSRQRAIDYMLENTSLTPLNIEREVDRYIAWPGQACAYKIGQLKISELRARAERALGPRFDIRAFHDTVLWTGSIPLPALEAKVNRWIASQRGTSP